MSFPVPIRARLETAPTGAGEERAVRNCAYRGEWARLETAPTDGDIRKYTLRTLVCQGVAGKNIREISRKERGIENED